MNKTWSKQAENFLINNCDKIKDKDLLIDLASRFGIIISMGALRKKRVRLGLKKKSGRGVNKLMSALGLIRCNLVIKGSR
jgi:hypothetical protein